MHTTMGADRPMSDVALAIAAGNEPIEGHTTGPLMVEPDGVYTTKVPPTADPAEAVIAAAVLVGTAWRLKDEDALVMTMRRLIETLDALEVAA